MSLLSKVPKILEHIEANQNRLKYNSAIFSMIEGDILSKVYAAIDAQLTGDSAKVAKDRVPPINVIRKVVDKLSTLYSYEVSRTTEQAKDKEMIDYYIEELDINSIFSGVNENFNAVKYGINEIYYDRNLAQIQVRACEPDLYLPYGDDPIDRTKMTVMIKFMGTMTLRKDGAALTGKEKPSQTKQANIYLLYSDDELLLIDDSGKPLYNEMAQMGIDSVNNYGVIPFSIVKRSKYSLIPLPDDDMLSMPILIPLLMTEINFAAMFLSNPIIYGVDVDTDKLQVSPLSMWSVKTDRSAQGSGKIDVLRPDPDLAGQSKWIMEQAALWLETKNIKAKHLVSIAQTGSVASGIALLLEEMDTSEDRAKQATYFRAFEADFWYRFGKIHNVLSLAGMIKQVQKFSDNLAVKASFAPVKIVEDQSQVVARVASAKTAGAMSTEMAVRLVNPALSDDEVAKEVELIKGERIGGLQAQNQTERPS